MNSMLQLASSPIVNRHFLSIFFLLQQDSLMQKLTMLELNISTETAMLCIAP